MPLPFFRVTAVAAAAFASLASCTQQPTEVPPSTAYAKTSTVNAPPKGACLTDEEMQAVRNEITWTQFYNAAIQCSGGTPKLRTDYNAFRDKFRSERQVGSAHLQRAAGKQRSNVGAFQTELANRDGGAAGGNPRYCSNALEGFRWALSQKVNSLNQVPPMMDFSSEMGVRSCTASPTPTKAPAKK